MKRFFAVVLVFCFFLSFSSCARDLLEENILARLNAPMEFDILFTVGETDGRAHLRRDDTLLSLGITDGPLKGLVVAASETNTRFLYEGMDVTFSADTTRLFSLIQKAFSFLKTQSFHSSIAREEGERLTYPFSEDGCTLEYTVTRENGEFSALLIQTEHDTVKLEKQ